VRLFENEARSAFAVGEKTLSSALVRERSLLREHFWSFNFGKILRKNFCGERAKMEGVRGRKFFAREPTDFPARLAKRDGALVFSGISDKVGSSGIV